jgi:shikimate kinase
MGAGKTTVGRALALRHGVGFVDLDARVGDVRAVFEREGEAGFRRRERRALRRASRGHGVLALGGGTVVDPANRACLRHWRVVVLRASLSTLRGRIGDDPSRPLAAALPRLLEERAAAYDAAGPAVDTDGLSVADVVVRVEELCGLR